MEVQRSALLTVSARFSGLAEPISGLKPTFALNYQGIEQNRNEQLISQLKEKRCHLGQED